MTPARDGWNGSRFRRDDPGGFYESYFQRANHPRRSLAFWIRYTACRRQGRPDEACGELWAIHFDGEAGRIAAVKETFPIAECSFSPAKLDVRIGGATLRRPLQGRAASAAHVLEWKLEFAGREPPLLLLREAFYERGFPKAKALVRTPNAAYTGSLKVDGVEIAIDGWRGSQNHNWGSRHTDRYAWGQVAGFDDAPDAFLECSTAQIKLGPFWSPRWTLAVLRAEGEEIKSLIGDAVALQADIRQAEVPRFAVIRGVAARARWQERRSRHVRSEGRFGHGRFIGHRPEHLPTARAGRLHRVRDQQESRASRADPGRSSS